MENRKVIYLLGLVFSIVFAIIYYILFQTFLSQKEESLTLYYNQIGLYQSSENAQKAAAQFKAQKIDAYVYTVDDMNSVICAISEKQEDTQAFGKKLKEMQIPYVEKTFVSQNHALSDALTKQDMKTVLELMNHESKGNESAGAST